MRYNLFNLLTESESGAVALIGKVLSKAGHSLVLLFDMYWPPFLSIPCCMQGFASLDIPLFHLV